MCIRHLQILFCGFRGFTKVDEALLFSSETRHQVTVLITKTCFTFNLHLSESMEQRYLRHIAFEFSKLDDQPCNYHWNAR